MCHVECHMVQSCVMLNVTWCMWCHVEYHMVYCALIIKITYCTCICSHASCCYYMVYTDVCMAGSDSQHHSLPLWLWTQLRGRGVQCNRKDWGTHYHRHSKPPSLPKHLKHQLGTELTAQLNRHYIIIGTSTHTHRVAGPTAGLIIATKINYSYQPILCTLID